MKLFCFNINKIFDFYSDTFLIRCTNKKNEVWDYPVSP